MGTENNKCLSAADCQRPTLERKLSYHQFANTQEIVSGLQSYTKKHRIIFYPTYERELIEHLFSLRQKHICDILVKLTEKRKQQQKKLLINDLMRIDLEKMDKMFFTLVRSQDLKEINTDLPIIKKHHDDKKQIKCQTPSNLSQQQRLKFVQIGQKVIRNKSVIVMACVQCFNGINCLTQGVLPSGKCCLELILDKVIALNDKYFHTDTKNQMPIQIIMLINSLYLEQTTELCSQKYPNLRWHAIKYQSVMPSFDSEGRITLKKSKNKENTKNDSKFSSVNESMKYRLDYSTQKGDLLGFIDQNYHIAQLLQHYDYIHWVDPCNVMENVCDPLAIGMMINDQCQAVSKIVRTVPFAKQHKNIIIKDNFIHNDIPQQVQSKNAQCLSISLSASSNNKIKHLIESVILSTKLLINREQAINKNLLTRIHKLKVSSYQNTLFEKQQSETEKQPIEDNGIYVFQRSIIDILHCRYTKIIFVNEKNEFSPFLAKFDYDKHGMLPPKVVYSNYCKRFLKIPQEKDTELVQVCPEILFGSQKKQKAIKNSVSNLKKIGFPLIIIRNLEQSVEKQ